MADTRLKSKKSQVKVLSFIWIFLFSFSCGEQNKDSEKEVSGDIYRLPVSSGFDFVGVVTAYGSLRCSGVLVKHGLFVSARHCFSSSEENGSKSLADFKITFPQTSQVTESDLSVVVTDIQYDTADTGVNDIAYLFYDETLTSGKIEPSNLVINYGDAVAAGTQMTTVGFPSNDSGELLKIGTYGCHRLERTGTIEPKRLDPGYEGMLYDTDCYAWKGNSGGGFFTATEIDGELVPLTLEGVVTHTFERMRSIKHLYHS